MGAIHARNLAMDRRIGRITLCETDKMRADALAASFGPRGPVAATRKPEEAFDGPVPDAFLITSPAGFHLDQLITASATGAYVFCEKPVAATYEQIRAKSAELMPCCNRIQIGFNRRFDPHLAEFKTRLSADRSGKIEQLTLVSRDHTPPVVGQLVNSAGLIAETMIHDLDTVRWLLDDEITSIFCNGGALINPEYLDYGHIDTATTVLVGRSGQQVVIQNSWRAPDGYDQRIEALCAKRKISVGNPRSSEVALHDQSGTANAAIRNDWSTRYIDAYRIEMTKFIDTVWDVTNTTPDLSDGIAASYLADRCAQSLATGQPQNCVFAASGLGADANM